MRSPEVSLGALGVSQWIPLDTYPVPPAVTLAGVPSSGANLTWAIQYTCDDIAGASAARDALGLSQAATTITITDAGPPSRGGTHGLSVGDYVKIFASGAANVDGEYSVASVVSATQYTVTSGTNQSAVSAQAKLITARVFPHAVLVGQTGRSTGNFSFGVQAARLQITAYVSGSVSLTVIQGGQPS